MIEFLNLEKNVRIISLAHYKSHTSPLFKSLGILNIKDMYNIVLCIKTDS